MRFHIDRSERVASGSRSRGNRCPFARGGGNTNWYYCRGPGDLDSLLAHLNPGAMVSFYLDDRIHHSASIEDARRATDLLLRKKGEALIGSLAADGLTVEMSIVVNVADLGEYISNDCTSSGSCLCINGPTPGLKRCD